MIVTKKEILFQLLLHIVVLVFFTYSWSDQAIRPDRVWFFLMYAIATVIISYVLMPNYLYKKKYLHFFLGVIVFLVILIVIEEKILEPWLYPDTKRANTFPGVFLSLFGVLPIMAILASGKFAWDALQKEERINELQSAVQESELQFLRSQINPHFLFNNLNNLYSYALEGSTKTPEIILEMSGVLRYMLYESKEQYVPLGKEIEQLENFIKLYKLQIEERGAVHFKVTDMTYNFKIAPLILVVFIENAFKHSQAGQSKDIKIEIDVWMKANKLHFRVKNNFEKATAEDTVAKGIGLVNVKKRLQLLYPDKHDLKIEEHQSEYFVEVIMELQQL
ncbi:sensor histidine kinase [Flavobacterium sp. ASW18X]|uniref:sensor histidine kinase n=1 Tax=Flavobacterium sp. ASW18X TaxID=2572595 RepID=UPI0010AEE9D2|nr:histidine kinase [Flavobacterium sp. ASW18X]TKD56562.1 GHKL domain-containing protein [Flavobacterium sp. ASW18X]